MSLVSITESMEMLSEKGNNLSIDDKEFVVQFAFRTEDMELTEKLIEELSQSNSDKNAIRVKYEQLKEKQISWVEKIENLLIALEMYREEEEKAVRRIAEFLRMNGAEIDDQRIMEVDIGEIRKLVSSQMSAGKSI